MSSFAMTVPYMRTSPVHIPRRDLVLGHADSIFLRVTVVDSDNPCAQAIDLTGGIGGPGLQMLVWPDTCYRTTWDYGALPTGPQSILWAGMGAISDAIGAFDISFPSGTMASWPRRCGWSVQLNYDTQGAEVLMSGKLHVRGLGKPYQAVTPGLMTDDYILVHTDIEQQVFA